jgi:hypothetical protein
MTTPNEFLERVFEAVDDAAFRMSHTPPDQQESWLEGYADRLRAQWRETFRPWLSASDVDGMVEDVVSRIRAKRVGRRKTSGCAPAPNHAHDPN